ncbi:hypothetical protein [Aliikangiella coralliicola]|uniref:Lipoprotein n=1 Tax=Aliikangiella coralliicola TaxID=2592383 RepID=A0A545UG53_9GAMM|nr:hypothetical protein [Aliikangiella coralliicola]TQV88456.1 hypothetical protein FLL46_07995 [Aliikangiella coralliicola]
MKINKNSILTVSVLSIVLLTGVGCNLNSKKLKQIGTVIAIGVAAKLIYDMIIEHNSKQVSDEKQVAEKYKATHNTLPSQPRLVSYQSNIKPGGVVNAGSQISILSSLEVVRGVTTENIEIKEKITIFDNEDSSKELKSLVKVVNAESNTGGAFENEFTFKLPKGMPQGIYPIKTSVIINGSESAPVSNQMQLVMNPDENLEKLRFAFNN